MDILHLDLKLLVAFEAMLATRNVTSAADAIGLTQPAMSTCLGKLRKVLGDPLFRQDFPRHGADPVRARIVGTDTKCASPDSADA
ncbi:LysR family transcriptional regulator [Undibacterium arcticum]